MSAQIRIAPSLLAADFTRLGQQIEESEAAGADLFHIDVMDGRFVPTLSFGALIVDAARRTTSLPLDVHLMVVEPDHMFVDMAKAGATSISIHWETGYHLHRSLTRIKELGCRAGIAINPHTPALMLTEILPLIDQIIVMTVNPGYGGQKLLPETLPKIRQLRALVESENRPIDLLIDGGINVETVSPVIAAGGTVLIAGHSIFNRLHSIQEGMSRLQQAKDMAQAHAAD